MLVDGAPGRDGGEIDGDYFNKTPPIRKNVFCNNLTLAPKAVQIKRRWDQGWDEYLQLTGN